MSRYEYQVLVAEDEPIILNDTVFEIENAEMGFHVKWTAYNGKDALDMIREEKPDVIFTDIKMPMMTGLEFIENIRREYPDLPIVLLTGFSQFDYARQAIRFNVEDYLLKPLDTDELRVVLAKIKKRLDGERKQDERNIVYSKVHGMEDGHTMPFQYENDFFEVYLIQIGNQYHYDFSERILELIQEVWKKADWDSWVLETFGEKMYWVIDEKKSNQKILIVVEHRRRMLEERKRFAEKLQKKLQDSCGAESVHIIMAEEGIVYREIRNVSGQLREIAESTKIGSEIVIQGGAEQKRKVSWLPSDLERKIEIDIVNGNLKGLKDEIGEALEDAEKKSCSQKAVEQGVLKIWRKMAGVNEPDNENPVFLQVRCDCFFEDSIPKEKIWNLLERKYLSANAGSNMEITIKEIEDFIIEHYAEDITVAGLSERFHFNGNYLTRMFKKYTGESPMNYLIRTRLNHAAELMEKREDLDIREISRMVGYEDSHYFSRIFKQKIGVSPSEYRKMRW